MSDAQGKLLGDWYLELDDDAYPSGDMRRSLGSLLVALDVLRETQLLLPDTASAQGWWYAADSGAASAEVAPLKLAVDESWAVEDIVQTLDLHRGSAGFPTAIPTFKVTGPGLADMDGSQRLLPLLTLTLHIEPVQSATVIVSACSPLFLDDPPQGSGWNSTRLSGALRKLEEVLGEPLQSGDSTRYARVVPYGLRRWEQD